MVARTNKTRKAAAPTSAGTRSGSPEAQPPQPELPVRSGITAGSQPMGAHCSGGAVMRLHGAGRRRRRRCCPGRCLADGAGAARCAEQSRRGVSAAEQAHGLSRSVAAATAAATAAWRAMATRKRCAARPPAEALPHEIHICFGGHQHAQRGLGINHQPVHGLTRCKLQGGAGSREARSISCRPG